MAMWPTPVCVEWMIDERGEKKTRYTAYPLVLPAVIMTVVVIWRTL